MYFLGAPGPLDNHNIVIQIEETQQKNPSKPKDDPDGIGGARKNLLSE